MAILKIESNHPEFSFFLRKNPATQKSQNAPFTRDLRSGKVHGWFNESATVFSMWFQDAEGVCSFATGRAADFEYLDITRYASPYAVVAMLSEMLATLVREQSETDIVGHYTHAVHIPAVLLPGRQVLRGFVNHFEADYAITVTELSGKLASVTIATQRSLHELVNLTMALMFLQSVAEKSIYVDLQAEVLKKIVGCLTRVGAPYFIWYLFNRDTVRSPEMHGKLRGSYPAEFLLNYGDTQVHRFHAIKPHLRGAADRTLVDIGCGEGYYMRRLATNYGTVIGYEADDAVRGVAEKNLKTHGVSNACLEGAFTPESVVPSGADVLITEVMEHMPQEQSKLLLQRVIASGPRRVVVTVPNVEFNPYYLLGASESRHDDHDWEPTPAEFEAFIRESIPAEGWDLVFSNIGDAVKGCSCSLMCVATSTKSEQ